MGPVNITWESVWYPNGKLTRQTDLTLPLTKLICPSSAVQPWIVGTGVFYAHVEFVHVDVFNGGTAVGINGAYYEKWQMIDGKIREYQMEVGLASRDIIHETMDHYSFIFSLYES